MVNKFLRRLKEKYSWVLDFKNLELLKKYDGAHTTSL